MPTQPTPPTIELSTFPSSNKPSVPILVNFLNTVPTPLTTVLVGLGPYISSIRQVAEIVSWKSSIFDGWLALAVWWGLCLLAEFGLRYLLPIAVLFMLAVNRWTTRPGLILPPVTENTIETILFDLSTVNALLPTLPDIPVVPVTVLLRVAALLYPPYILLTYLVRLRVLVGIAGTVLLSWRAPWARVIRHNLWANAWVRWSIYHAWAALSGQPLPPMTLSFQPTSTSLQPVNEIRFLFTIYENQRWWVTLDWTPALLPSERPAWCSHTHDAVSPPSAFSLPEPSSVFLADTGGGRVKRTAMWRWEESEWRVLVKKQGSQVRRVGMPQPTTTLDSPPRSRLARAVSFSKEPAPDPQEASGSGLDVNANDNEEKGAPLDESPDPTPEEHATDADGWVYCDNKWENSSNVNGIGKFTRYRRWARIAVVSEMVEAVEAGGVGIQHLSVSTHVEGDPALQSPTNTTSGDATAETSPGVSPIEIGGDAGEAGESSRKRATLRQRMQESLRKGPISIGPTS